MYRAYSLRRSREQLAVKHLQGSVIYLIGEIKGFCRRCNVYLIIYVPYCYLTEEFDSQKRL